VIAAGLAGAIDKVWVSEIPNAGGSEVVLPTGRAQLIFGLDPEHPVATIQGPATAPSVIDRGSQRRAVGVVFSPGGLRAFAGEATSDFTNLHVDLQELGLDGEGMIEELRTAFDEGREVGLRRVDRLLHSQLRSIDRTPSVEALRASTMLAAGRRVSEVRDELGLSRARLRNLFEAEIGPLPKLYARVRRLEATVACVRRDGAMSLATIAAEAGYADQAHMTRDFSELAGVTPGLLHGNNSRSPNHLAA